MMTSTFACRCSGPMLPASGSFTCPKAIPQDSAMLRGFMLSVVREVNAPLECLNSQNGKCPYRGSIARLQPFDGLTALGARLCSLLRPPAGSCSLLRDTTARAGPVPLVDATLPGVGARAEQVDLSAGHEA